MNEHTRFLCKQARKRGIKCAIFPNENFCRLTKGKKSVLVYGGVATVKSSSAGFMMARDKSAAHSLLKKDGFPVLPQIYTEKITEAQAFLKKHKNVVTKPARQKKGKGITVGIESVTELRSAWKIAAEFATKKIVEKYAAGIDHRVLVIDFKHVYAIQRFPAFVIGDDKHTIKQLITFKNKTINKKQRRKPIIIDEALKLYLKKHNLRTNRIPPRGAHVQVRGTANVHTGGETKDVTSTLSAAVKKEAIAVAKAFSLGVVGIDYLSFDLNKKRYIIEVNEDPGLQLHHFPVSGQALDPTSKLLDMLFT